MIVVSLSFLFALISSITCAFINGSTSKTDLKEGNSVDVTFKLTFAEGEKLVLFKILNNDKIIAQDAGSSFGLTEYARSIFGGRISSTSPISGSYIYKLTISDLLANDSMTLTAELLYSNPAEVYLKTNAAIPININGAVEGGGLHGEKGTNTGTIVGIVIGVLVLVAIIIVVAFLAYRYKKSHPTSTSPKESAVLHPKQKNDDTYSHYAASTVSVKSDDRKPPTQQYAELGLGGGRDGPKPKNVPSNYSQVKTDDLGYPAKGPTAQSKPSSGYMDKGDVEENDGIIV